MKGTFQMALKQHSTHTALKAQETQTDLQFILTDGPHFNGQANEWEIWLDGEPRAWAGNERQAWRSYHDLVDYSLEYKRRIKVNGHSSVTEIEVDWYICDQCGASVDSGAECHICNQPELCDDWFIINHVDGKTSISRNGSVRFEEAR
jgi:hypothetical protein